MNYQEQLAKINATIKAKHARIGEIMTKSVSNGHTPSDEDENTITELETDIARLEKSAERLQKLIKSVETATPSLTEVAGETPEQAAASADGVPDPIKGAVNEAVKFEQSMAEVKKVVDFDTPQAFKKMQDDIIGLSQKLPMAADQIAQIMAAAGQAGIAQAELFRFTESAVKMGVAFDITAEQAGQAMAEMRVA